MSRIGKKPIPVPSPVKVQVESRRVQIEGPKGKLALSLPDGIEAKLDQAQILVSRSDETGRSHALHGLTRTLIANNVIGVTEGFRKELEIEGLGYKAIVQGKILNLQFGYSHPILFDIPNGIDIAVDKQTHITVTGADRQLVGQVAANIRRLRKPDPYKQKGVRYTGEVLKKKVGKTGA